MIIIKSSEAKKITELIPKTQLAEHLGGYIMQQPNTEYWPPLDTFPGYEKISQGDYLRRGIKIFNIFDDYDGFFFDLLPQEPMNRRELRARLRIADNDEDQLEVVDESESLHNVSRMEHEPRLLMEERSIGAKKIGQGFETRLGASGNKMGFLRRCFVSCCGDVRIRSSNDSNQIQVSERDMKVRGLPGRYSTSGG